MGWLATSAAERPSVERATPTRGRLRRLIDVAFSVTASASTVLKETPRRVASARRVSRSAVAAVTVVRALIMMRC